MPLHSPISLGFWALETTLSLERKAAAGMLVKIRVKRLAVVEKRKTLINPSREDLPQLWLGRLT